jgi:hypothetical protein
MSAQLARIEKEARERQKAKNRARKAALGLTTDAGATTVDEPPVTAKSRKNMAAKSSAKKSSAKKPVAKKPAAAATKKKKKMKIQKKKKKPVAKKASASAASSSKPRGSSKKDKEIPLAAVDNGVSGASTTGSDDSPARLRTVRTGSRRASPRSGGGGGGVGGSGGGETEHMSESKRLKLLAELARAEQKAKNRAERERAEKKPTIAVAAADIGIDIDVDADADADAPPPAESKKKLPEKEAARPPPSDDGSPQQRRNEARSSAAVAEQAPRLSQASSVLDDESGGPSSSSSLVGKKYARRSSEPSMAGQSHARVAAAHRQTHSESTAAAVAVAAGGGEGEGEGEGEGPSADHAALPEKKKSTGGGKRRDSRGEGKGKKAAVFAKMSFMCSRVDRKVEKLILQHGGAIVSKDEFDLRRREAKIPQIVQEAMNIGGPDPGERGHSDSDPDPDDPDPDDSDPPRVLCVAPKRLQSDKSLFCELVRIPCVTCEWVRASASSGRVLWPPRQPGHLATPRTRDRRYAGLATPLFEGLNIELCSSTNEWRYLWTNLLSLGGATIRDKLFRGGLGPGSLHLLLTEELELKEEYARQMETLGISSSSSRSSSAKETQQDASTAQTADTADTADTATKKESPRSKRRKRELAALAGKNSRGKASEGFVLPVHNTTWAIESIRRGELRPLTDTDTDTDTDAATGAKDPSSPDGDAR